MFKARGGMDAKTLNENSQKARKVMDFMVRNCCQCNVQSSKRRLFKTPDGEMCQMCIGGSLQDAVDKEFEYLEFLKAEAAKPPPENYGEWS